MKTVGCCNRCVDTEAKTLEQITRDLGAVKHTDGSVDWGNTSVKGTINLFTEREPCPGCYGVIEQFNLTGKKSPVSTDGGSM